MRMPRSGRCPQHVCPITLDHSLHRRLQPRLAGLAACFARPRDRRCPIWMAPAGPALAIHSSSAGAQRLRRCSASVSDHAPESAAGCSRLHASCLGVRRPEPSPAPLRTRETRMIRVLYLLFVLSGAAGLVYESIWTRYLGLFVGHDAYAQIVVLVIFLGGMSLGAMAVGRWSERVREPLKGYVAVECAVGCIGLIFHDLFQWVTGLAYGTIYPALAGSAALPVAKWTLAGLLILPQSVLLGATFPLMAAGVLRIRPAKPGRTLAVLYFCNSLGAAAGVLVAGFYLVYLAGLPGTLLVAAMLNLGVALATIGVIAVRRRRRPMASAPAPLVDARTPAARPARARRPRAAAPGRGVRDRGGLVSLRDRLDPHALAGPGERDPLVRADALRVHSGPRPGIALDPEPGRRSQGAGARAGPGPVGDGRLRAGHPAALRRLVRLDRRAAVDLRPHRPGLRRLHRGPLRPLPRDHASGHLLCRDDAAAPDPDPAPGRSRRARDRRGVRLEHARIDRGRDRRRAGTHPARGAQGDAAHRGGIGHGDRGDAARLGRPGPPADASAGAHGGGGRGAGGERGRGCGPARRGAAGQRRLPLRPDAGGRAARHAVLSRWPNGDRVRAARPVHRNALPRHQRQDGRLARTRVAPSLQFDHPAGDDQRRRGHPGAASAGGPRPPTLGPDGRRHRLRLRHVVPLPAGRTADGAGGDDRDRARDGRGGTLVLSGQPARGRRPALGPGDRRREVLLRRRSTSGTTSSCPSRRTHG